MKWLIPLAIVFVVLKLAGVLAISWAVALIPIWLVLAVFIIFFVIGIILS